MEDKQREETQGTIDTLTIFTLLVRCPTGGLPTESCPFAPLRGRHTLEEKLRIAESLSQNKRREMLATHNQCLATGYAKETSDN